MTTTALPRIGDLVRIGPAATPELRTTGWYRVLRVSLSRHQAGWANLAVYRVPDPDTAQTYGAGRPLGLFVRLTELQRRPG